MFKLEEFHLEYVIETDSWNLYIFKRNKDGTRTAYEIKEAMTVPKGANIPRAAILDNKLGDRLAKVINPDVI